MTDQRTERLRLTVTGQVQGVGFRPFAYRLACELALTGFVRNDGRGVTVEIQGPTAALRTFRDRLARELPPLANMASCESEPLETMAVEHRFEILPSDRGEIADAQVTVDIATCSDCLSELRDPADPRFGYPFINCTNCGPRYSIVRRIPYDRPNTTMADFAMCPLCADQYADPGDRRFHAQPVACPACGPAVWLIDPQGKQIACDDPIAATHQMLRAGRIVAVKGLGGFHLACRADNGHAVDTLRRRKHRESKPLAVMVHDVAAARTFCNVSDAAAELLQSPQAPIVLLPRRPAAPIAADVADGLNTLGLMLPSTPLHHLLTEDDMPPLVMTSGNYSDQPLVKDTDAAVAHFAQLADAMLVHNRDIERRIDDSVIRLMRDDTQVVLRRARGYAPAPILLSGQVFPDAPGDADVDILAVGAELKNTICLLTGDRAVVSEHIGDLKDGRVYRHFIDTINHLEALFDVGPRLIAADMHPQYLSSQYAERRHRGELAGHDAVAIEHVQHHHAHAVACLVENQRAGPAIAVVCDGVGYGDDGAVWGCEILTAELHDFRRVGHLRYLPLPGGDTAAVETIRPAVAALHDTFGDACGEYLSLMPFLPDERRIATVTEQLDLQLNCPPSSSLGRWFDAIAFMVGLTQRNDHEAQAAMLLEAAADPSVADAYDFRIVSDGPFTIDLRPMVEQLVADVAGHIDGGTIAAKFHNTVVAFLRTGVLRVREACGLSTVALSGGCFANEILLIRLRSVLSADGFDVLTHRTPGPGDGSIALGQAAVAAARRTRLAGQRMESSDVPCDSSED